MYEKGIKNLSLYSYTLPWEEAYNHDASTKYMLENWHIPFIWSFFIYLPTIYGGQYMMKNLQPFQLKLPLLLWNIALAIFSIIGLSRVLPEFLHTINRGFYYSVCDNSFIEVKEASFWVYIFVVSKIAEFVDTVFLVLKKRPLIFLHVYHHSSVLILTWFVYANSTATARWFYVMNYSVHSVMYTYYALKLFPEVMKIPRWVSMMITASQTAQMVMGAYIAGFTYYTQLRGYKCDVTAPIFLLTITIYLSYLFLFGRFFYQAYCAPRPAKAFGHVGRKCD